MRTKLIFLLCGATVFGQQLYNPGPPVNFQAGPASLSYRDAAGDLRTLDLYVRVPQGSGPFAAVIWSPEAGAQTNAQDSLTQWNETTARAGYLSVAIHQPVRDRDESLRLCAALGLDEAGCILLQPRNWDWVQDVRQVVNWLIQQNQSGGELRGRIDPERIALAGYGDGSNAAMSLAGARRMQTSPDRTKTVDYTDARIAAFLCISPMGPLVDGFFEYDVSQPTHSWMTVRRPVLLMTAAGDNNCGPGCRIGDTPARRRVVFDLLPKGDKYQLFLKTVNVSHEFMGTLDGDSCAAAGVPTAECSRHDQWLRSAALAFLDGHVRNRAAALTWLKDGLIRSAVTEWEVK